MEIDNIFEIDTSLDFNFFKKWFSFLAPFNGLNKREVEVLSLFAYKRFLLSDSITEINLLDSLIFNSEYKREIKELSGLTYPRFIAIISSLKQKGVIVDNKIIKKLIPQVVKDDTGFRLLVKFNFNDFR